MDTQVGTSWISTQPINLTESVFNRQNSLQAELRRGLDQHIVGQDRAKEALEKTILNGLFNIYREQWAFGAIFLGGPTGVGKTEMARSLARLLLGDPNAFTKISGASMPHPANIEKLVGSGAGYVGYGDTPMMADTRIHAGYKAAKEKKTLHPILQSYDAINFSIVLVDEIEKAHPDIPNAFLDAIQAGEMEMSSGKEGNNSIHSRTITHSRVTDLRNTLFIFTSNIGEHQIQQGKRTGIGFSQKTEGSGGDDATFEKELRKHFAPEFLGRMDAVVRCHSLTDEQIRQILSLHVEKMNRILEEKQYYAALQITTTHTFVDHILRQAKEMDYGARAISGIVKDIGSQVGLALQSGKLPKDANGVIEFDIQSASPVIQFRDQSSSHPKRVPEIINPKTSIREQVRNFVEGKINRYGDEVRASVQEYLKLIAWYDTGFRDACRILEKQLHEYGFSAEDIRSLQGTAFLSIYESVEQPAIYEIITRNDGLFGPIGFRPIEKYLRSAIANEFTLSDIYQSIRVILKRPMVRDEAVVISQHIHRLLLSKKPA